MDKLVVKLKVPVQKIAGEHFITPAIVAEKLLSDCRFMNYRQLCRVLPDVKQASFVRVGIAPEFTRTADFVGLKADTPMFCFAAQMQYYRIDRFETDYAQSSLIMLYEPCAEFVYIVHSGLVKLSEPIESDGFEVTSL